MLLEYVDGELVGREESDAAILLRQATSAGVPVVVWATAGGPPVRAEALAAAAPFVHVADEHQVEAWRAVVPDVLVLPRATSVRRHAHPGQVRTGATIRVDRPVAPESPALVAPPLSRPIRPLHAITVIPESPRVPPTP